MKKRMQLLTKRVVLTLYVKNLMSPVNSKASGADIIGFPLKKLAPHNHQTENYKQMNNRSFVCDRIQWQVKHLKCRKKGFDVLKKWQNICSLERYGG